MAERTRYGDLRPHREHRLPLQIPGRHLRDQDIRQWLRILTEADIQSSDEHARTLLRDPHVRAEPSSDAAAPSEGLLRMMSIPQIWSASARTAALRAPRLGEHTVQLLAEVRIERGRGAADRRGRRRCRHPCSMLTNDGFRRDPLSPLVKLIDLKTGRRTCGTTAHPTCPGGLHREVELSDSASAPFAGHVLAGPGRRVWKVEPGGDSARAAGAPAGGKGCGAAFHAISRGRAPDLPGHQGSGAAGHAARPHRAPCRRVPAQPAPGQQRAIRLDREPARAQAFPEWCVRVGAYGHVGPLNTLPGYDPPV